MRPSYTIGQKSQEIFGWKPVKSACSYFTNTWYPFYTCYSTNRYSDPSVYSESSRVSSGRV